MNYYIFKKEDDDFSEVFNDNTLKPLFKFKIKFFQHLILGSHDPIDEKLSSYITLKFGDILVNKTEIFKDFSPKMHKDYEPDPKRPDKFKNL